MEKISIEINKQFFDELVERGILPPESFVCLELTRDVPAHLYADIKNRIAEEYERFDVLRGEHKKRIKELYKELDELQHGTETNE